MPTFKELEPGLHISGQLVREDFAVAAAAGFRSIVNNRPDGEAADQLPNETAAASAHKLGLRYLYQPVPGLNVADDEVVDAFRAAMESLPRPVLFYCRSGTRCTILWAQASAHRLGTAHVIATAAAAGYDLGHVREFIEAQAARGSTWGAF